MVRLLDQARPAVAAPVTRHERAAFEQLTAGLATAYTSATSVEVAAEMIHDAVGLPVVASGGRRAWYLGISPGTVSLRTRGIHLADNLTSYVESPRDLVDHMTNPVPREGWTRPDYRVRGWKTVPDRPEDVEPQLRGLEGTTVGGITVESMPDWAADLDLDPAPSAKRGRVTEWSRASRRRMVRAIAELDYAGWFDEPGVLAMVTLTLPGQWEQVAPDGRTWKRLIDTFRKRWLREVGTPWRGLWKMEFQRRGAPHQHMLLRVPSVVGEDREVFETWLSRTWADLCRAAVYARDTGDGFAYEAAGEYERHLRAGTAVDFSGARFSDPRRTAIYFLKHSAKTTDDKEYQHVVPRAWRLAGDVGRFWGYWGLRRSHVELEVSRADFHHARRIMRHVARASAARVELARRRYAGESPWEMTRTVAWSFGARGGGWHLATDGLDLAFDLARAVAMRQAQRLDGDVSSS